MPASENLLPEKFTDWFRQKSWDLRDHQADMIRAANEGLSVLLTAPTGGGKTLAGFLPSLIDLDQIVQAHTSKVKGRPHRLHTLYISPLKALSVDVARNLEEPAREMGIDIRIETRTGDTPASRRTRQKSQPPDILMTTPEQLALILSYEGAGHFFEGLSCVVLDELHALVGSKRGDLLALDLARLSRLCPDVRRVGLSATVADPDWLRAWLMPQKEESDEPVLSELVIGKGGAKPRVTLMETETEMPWGTHSGRHALGDVYEAIQNAKVSLVFVNTRSQAEMIFQYLWHMNEENLPIALHHGSLSVEQRRKVEAAMVRGDLRAVVCTATLDMGIDWGDVDQVICVGAPKGASRLVQRIGRANHRLDEPSLATLVPANRFELLECKAAMDAVHEGLLDGDRPQPGALDVLAQHIWGMACAGGFVAEELYEEVVSAFPYQRLSFRDFMDCIGFVEDGGYALKRYDRYKKLIKGMDEIYRLSNPRLAQMYRMNMGTIVEQAMLKVRQVRPRARSLRGGRYLGEVEEFFIDQLVQGDTFLFAGQVLRFEGIREMEAYASPTSDPEPMIPSYGGNRFPLSTFLSERVRMLLADKKKWKELPNDVQEWLGLQEWRSLVPKASDLLIEFFPRANRYYLVCYPFEGRIAHQTLGMLLTKRLERMGLHPMGFIANEYALAIWGVSDMSEVRLDELFDEDMLGDDLEAWMAESSLLKRSFRYCATIAGLIERRFPGQEKSGRQMTISSDLLYNVLKDHEPDHVLLRATWHDAAKDLLDVERLGHLLRRIRGHMVTQKLDRVSPLAVPVLMEIGKELIYGEAGDALLNEAADSLIEEATRLT